MRTCAKPECSIEIPDDRKNKYCRGCWREITRKARAKSPEAARAATKRWQEKNAEARKAYRKEYQHRPEVAERKRAAARKWYHGKTGQAWYKKYREEHAERSKECLAAWRRNNPEQLKALKRASYQRVGKETATEYRKKNKEGLRRKEAERWVREKSVILARLREWRKTPAGIAFIERHRNSTNVKFAARYRTDPEFRAAILDKTAKRKAENPEKFAEYQRRGEARRGRPKGKTPETETAPIPGVHTVEQWLELYARSGAQCHYCGRSLTLAEASPDHAIPVSKGGGDNIENLRVSCWPCNKLKGAKTEREFIAYLIGSK